MNLITLIYVFVLCGMGVLSCQSLLYSLLYLAHLRDEVPAPPQPEVWPVVTVQLPVYNERFVIGRLIEAVCRLDYPRQALTIQVLDDSTDETRALAQALVEIKQSEGHDIRLLPRDERRGYKAGALAEGLKHVQGDLIAIFDADYLPRPDFLRITVPYFTADSLLGMLQARCDHLNRDENLLTRGQALSLDTNFVVIQPARQRSGLLLTFNGSGGIWRRECIEDAGGWDGSNLTEDLDLSYRAQLKGWRTMFLPEVTVPGELPEQFSAFKQQQQRWAQGGIQTLLKLRRALWRAPLSPAVRLVGTLHLASYLWHPLMLLYALISLPLLLQTEIRLPSMIWLLPVSFGPPLLFLLSQWNRRPGWARGMAYFPVIIFYAAGLCLSNTVGVLRVFLNRTTPFLRTPKSGLQSRAERSARTFYRPAMDWTVWGELALCAYALAGFLLALDRLPLMAPTLGLLCISFGFVGGIGLWERMGESISRLQARFRRIWLARSARDLASLAQGSALGELRGQVERGEKNHS